MNLIVREEVFQDLVYLLRIIFNIALTNIFSYPTYLFCEFLIILSEKILDGIEPSYLV